MSGIFIPDCTQEEIDKVLMYARIGANNCMIGVRKHFIPIEDEDIELPRWIPVSEGLPEEKFSGGAFGFDFEEVLCTTIWGDVRSYKFGKPKGHDKPHFWLCGTIMDVYVIAWQYKPKPYQEARGEA